MTTTITIAFRIFFNKKFQLIRSLHISFYIFNGAYASEAEARVRGEAEARVSRVKSRKLAASPLSLSLSLSLSLVRQRQLSPPIPYSPPPHTPSSPFLPPFPTPLLSPPCTSLPPYPNPCSVKSHDSMISTACYFSICMPWFLDIHATAMLPC